MESRSKIELIAILLASLYIHKFRFKNEVARFADVFIVYVCFV